MTSLRLLLLVPVLGAVLALGACASDDSPQAQCRRSAYDDPTVKDLTIRSLGSQGTAAELRADLNDAVNAATVRCLRARGLAPPGGVEKERREH